MGDSEETNLSCAVFSSNADGLAASLLDSRKAEHNSRLGALRLKLA